MTTEYALLRSDGRLEFSQAEDDALRQTLRSHISDLSSQGAGSVRMWFHDTFTQDTPRNYLAEHVIGELGYHHPYGWYGTVALTMEEDPFGRIGSLVPEIRSIIEHAASQVSWAQYHPGYLTDTSAQRGAENAHQGGVSETDHGLATDDGDPDHLTHGQGFSH